MSRNRYSDTECPQSVTWCLEGRGTTAVQKIFTIGGTKHLHIGQQCGIGAKTISHEDFMHLGVVMKARKSVEKRDLE